MLVAVSNVILSLSCLSFCIHLRHPVFYFSFSLPPVSPCFLLLFSASALACLHHFMLTSFNQLFVGQQFPYTIISYHHFISNAHHCSCVVRCLVAAIHYSPAVVNAFGVFPCMFVIFGFRTAQTMREAITGSAHCLFYTQQPLTSIQFSCCNSLCQLRRIFLSIHLFHSFFHSPVLFSSMPHLLFSFASLMCSILYISVPVI